jgi:phage terminase small subunit
MPTTVALSPKQQKFVDEYLVSGNGTQSALMAGYGKAGAHVAAHRLLSNVNVSTAVRTRRGELAAKHEVTRDRVMDGLLEAVDLARAQADPGAMIRAWAEIGRLCGFYAAEKTVKVDVNIAAKRVIENMETLSDCDLLTYMEPEVLHKQ